MDTLNDTPYSDIAAIALSQPGVWRPLRKEQATANLVTQINTGKHSAFLNGRFIARSRSWTEKDSRRKYDIEVRASAIEDTDINDIVSRITQSVLPEIEKLITDAIKKEMCSERLSSLN